MIVQPDFPEHWKTRRLVELTGDESAPMAVLRLWAHCQHSKRSLFPDMTREQLASICRWGERKPACHVAMLKAGFVDKLTPKGFAAHQWNEHNAQLLQKWAAGAKGGRPSKDESACNDNELEKPTGNRPRTGPVPDRLDPIDQIREEKIDPTDPIDAPEANDPIVGSGSDGEFSSSIGGDGDGMAVVQGITDSLSTAMHRLPTIGEVRRLLSLQFAGAEKYAAPALKALKKSKMRGRDGEPIQDLSAWLKNYASTCERNQRGVGNRNEIKDRLGFEV